MADIAGFFKKTLPAMAAAVASGVPGPIGAVAQIIGGALNKDVKADAQAITAAVAGATPDQVIALRKADQDFQVTMQKMGFEHVEEMEKIAAEDRASARQRESAVRDWVPRVLAIGTVLMLMAVILLLFFVEIPQSTKDTLLFVLGVLVAASKDVYGYYFGSSHGSDAKTDLLAAQGGANK